jgi:GntR family transcriptional regulator, transcriptional repressor for pyruvate dehydrogenase complex
MRVPVAVETALQIRRLIAERGLGPGDKLPSEREFTKILGVSRTSVRAALKELQATGIAETSAARGTYVSTDGSKSIATSIQSWFEANRLSLPELIEFRRALEPAVAAAAAQHRSEDDLRHLSEQIGSMRRSVKTNDSAMFSAADNAFHRQIAVASSNRLFLLMTDATGETLRLYRETAARLGPAMLRRSLQDHEAIFEAIARSDPGGARDAMVHHIVETVIDFRIVSREEIR